MKTIIKIIGYFLIIIGVLAIFTPVLYGILFIALGFSLVVLYDDKLSNFLEKHLQKYPKILKLYIKYRNQLKKLFKK